MYICANWVCLCTCVNFWGYFWERCLYGCQIFSSSLPSPPPSPSSYSPSPLHFMVCMSKVYGKTPCLCTYVCMYVLWYSCKYVIFTRPLIKFYCLWIWYHVHASGQETLMKVGWLVGLYTNALGVLWCIVFSVYIVVNVICFSLLYLPAVAVMWAVYAKGFGAPF